MTAKHRKGKSNHKQDDNFFKNEVMETEVRAGGNNNNYSLLLLLNLIILLGGAACAWFCFQQHQTLSYLTDNLMGVQVKIGKLQTYHEEMRLSKSKEHVSESIETRLAALEESYTLTQKQVGIALAAAEQLKTSDLPTQVLSLHTEMKARLAEVQQATVSVEQLGRLQSMLKEKSEEFEVVRTQVEDLATHNGELSQKVEALTGSLGETESMLEGEIDQIANLGATLDGQATEVLGLKDKLHEYQTQLEASILEMATVRELIKNERSRQLQQASVGEELNTVRKSLQDHASAVQSLHSELSAQLENIQKQLEEETQPPAEPLELREEDTTVATGEGEAEEPAPATGEDEVDAVSEEEEEAPTNEDEEAETVEEEAGEAATEGAVETEQSAPVGQEAASSQEYAEADEDEEAAAIEQEPSKAQEPIPEEEDVDAAPTEGEEQTVEEENKEAGDAEVEEESAAEEEDDDDESEDVMESEGEEEQGNQEEEGKQDKAVEVEPQEEEESLEDDALSEDD
ncbi:uncharacterized protein ACNS7B_007899 isoform 2-T2 [Menidia menidia]